MVVVVVVGGCGRKGGYGGTFLLGGGGGGNINSVEFSREIGNYKNYTLNSGDSGSHLDQVF